MSHQDLVRYPARGPANGQQPHHQQAQQVADDVWMQQQALAVAGPAVQPTMLAHGGGAGNEVQPLQMVHRSLRGRYKLAILLAAIGAVVGTAVGWTQNEKVFRAKGTIRVEPQLRFVNGVTEATPEYTRSMGSEATYIKTQELVTRALARPEWKQVPGADSWDAPAFMSRLTSTYGNNLYDINVTFDHPNRDIAQAAVKAVLKAFEDYRAEQRTNLAENGVDFWTGEVNRLGRELANLTDKKLEIQRRDTGGNIEIGIQHSSEQLAQRQGKVDADQSVLRRMRALKDNYAKNPPQFTPQQLAPREPLLARLLSDREAAQAELVRVSRVGGMNAPAARNQRDMMDSMDAKITQITQALSQNLYGIIPNPDPNGTPFYVDDKAIADAEANLALDQQDLKDIETRVAAQNDVRWAMAKTDNDITAAQDRLNAAKAKLDEATARSSTVAGNVRTFPSPLVDIAEDKRPTMATFGFVAGGALPLAGLVLYGLFDRKYRYSDETTTGGSTRGVPLLGILPNLPDRLSDPSQASVAAHCVHQIRTMLQLNVLGEGPSVLSVTSATSGDGKTSLSLALGLSFAASGSRTLLIDTDLIGAGLSSRLGIREPHGIGEAIASRDPMSYVRETDVGGLSVLPVGTEGGQNASAFSPSAVRRLIAQVREHFDIVLVDTGPVLGSIEATPVVAASDAVILTVARGQNRDLVEKAIGHLRAIGARIAGVVFNRANARDFERSISGISLRSVSRASSLNGVNGHQSANGERQDKRLGPLVHSVRGTREETN